MSPRFFSQLLVVLCLSGSGSIASAQNPLEWLRDRDFLPEVFPERNARSWEGNRRSPSARGLRATEQGKGTLGMRGPNRALREATVVLDQDGSAEFLFRGERDYRFAGNWRRAAANKVLVTIDRTYGRVPATGSGTITLGNDSFYRIDLTGNSRALEGDFNVRFQVGDVDRKQVRFSLDTTERGRGSIGMSGPNRRLSQARVVLQRDGDARLSLYGDDEFDFAGTWSMRNRGVADLRLTRGPGNVRVDATGTVTLNERSFSQLEVLGRSQAMGGRIRVSFDCSDRQHVGGKVRGLTSDVVGRGSIGLRGPNKVINRAMVTLTRNGNAVLRLLGKEECLVAGTWFSGDDANVIHLEIDQVGPYRGAAAGSGKLVVERGQVVAIDARGRAQGAGGDFRITFRAGSGRSDDRRVFERERGPGNDRQRLPEIQSSQHGTGRYVSNASNAVLDNASVHLHHDGTAALSFTGRNSYRFSGTWTLVRDGVAQVSLTKGPRGVAVNGSGTVQVNGERLVSAQLTGSSRSRGSFQVSFQADRAGGPFGRALGKTFQWRFGR